jgi:hypothetical protein
VLVASSIDDSGIGRSDEDIPIQVQHRHRLNPAQLKVKIWVAREAWN